MNSAGSVSQQRWRDRHPTGLEDVYRVALHACQSCGHLMPTPAGQAKVDRCVARGIEFLLGLLRRKIEPDPHQPRFIRTIHRDGYCLTLGP